MTIHVSEELYRLAKDVAAAERRSVEEVFALVFGEKAFKLEGLKEKASRGTYEKFQKVMAKVLRVEPAEHDQL